MVENEPSTCAKTIEDDAEYHEVPCSSATRGMKAAKDAESAAKMKFSEKRAYTVARDCILEPHTSKALKANKNKKWVTVSSSFVELSEGRRGQGIIEAAHVCATVNARNPWKTL